METLNLYRISPLSPSAILAHLRQRSLPKRPPSPKISHEVSRQVDSPTLEPNIHNDSPKHLDNTDIDNSGIQQPYLEQTPIITKKVHGILKDTKKSLILRSPERFCSTPNIEQKILEDCLLKLKSSPLSQTIEKDGGRAKRNSVTRFPSSLEGSRPSSKSKKLSPESCKSSPKSRRHKKVTFSPDTKDPGVYSELTPVKIRRPIPPLKGFLKDEGIETDSIDVFTPKPMFVASPKPVFGENNVKLVIRSQERRQHGSPFNVHIKQRPFRELESPSRKRSMNSQNIEIISDTKDPTPLGRSCTPRETQRPEGIVPLKLNHDLINQFKATESMSPFASPKTGSLSARNTFNVNVINSPNQRNNLLIERGTPKDSPPNTDKMLKGADFGRYSDAQQHRNKLISIEKPYRYSVQQETKMSNSGIAKVQRSVFSSVERLGILNALKARDIRLDP